MSDVVRHPRRAVLLWALGVLAVLGGYGLLHSPAFRLETITVTGNEHLSTARVMESTGLYPGELFWMAPTGTVKRRLERSPWIEQAQVNWKVPGELVVNITEREPIALIPYYDFYLMLDGEGRSLELTGSLAGAKLPVITGLLPEPVLLGQTVQTDGLSGALAALAALEPAWRNLIAELHVDDKGELMLYGEGGLAFLYGAPTELPAKALALAAGWQEVQAKGIAAQLIDLRNPAMPVIRPHK